jgi:hypothetical protein
MACIFYYNHALQTIASKTTILTPTYGSLSEFISCADKKRNQRNSRRSTSRLEVLLVKTEFSIQLLPNVPLERLLVRQWDGAQRHSVLTTDTSGLYVMVGQLQCCSGTYFIRNTYYVIRVIGVCPLGSAR